MTSGSVCLRFGASQASSFDSKRLGLQVVQIHVVGLKAPGARPQVLGFHAQVAQQMDEFVDVDNDGWLDLYVFRQGNNWLYRNLGDGTFTREDDSVAVIGTGSADSRHAAWADMVRCGLSNNLSGSANPTTPRRCCAGQ